MKYALLVILLMPVFCFGQDDNYHVYKQGRRHNLYHGDTLISRVHNKSNNEKYNHFEVSGAYGLGFNTAPKSANSYYGAKKGEMNTIGCAAAGVYISPHVFLGVDYSQTSLSYKYTYNSVERILEIAKTIKYIGLNAYYNFSFDNYSTNIGLSVDRFVSNGNTSYNIRGYSLGMPISIKRKIIKGLYGGLRLSYNYDWILEQNYNSKWIDVNDKLNRYSAMAIISYRF